MKIKQGNIFIFKDGGHSKSCPLSKDSGDGYSIKKLSDNSNIHGF